MALIHKIIPFSCVDGPGNRAVIFFQKCNFNCTYCHNPETIELCINCGDCVAGCPVGALSTEDEQVKWQNEICVNCGQCITACTHYSNPKTREISVGDVLSEIKKISPFIKGITVSGGECTLYADFLSELFIKVKSELALTCFVDTNGGIDLSAHENLVDITDAFMLDVKAWSDNEHIKVTGTTNSVVLKNLDYLLKKNKLHEVRTVIAPELENNATVRKISEKITDRCIYKLIPYRKYGVSSKGLEFHGEAGPSSDEMSKFVEFAKENGAVKAMAVHTDL